MKSLEQLRQEQAAKERSIGILSRRLSIAAEQQIAAKKRLEEEKVKAAGFLAQSNFSSLAWEFVHLLNRSDWQKYAELDPGYVRIKKEYLKERDGMVQFSALMFPYDPGETSAHISIHWNTDFFGRFKGRSGIIIEALPSGEIKTVGAHTIVLKYSEWNGNSDLQERTFDHAIQNPVRLSRRKAVEIDTRPNIPIEGPGAW